MCGVAPAVPTAKFSSPGRAFASAMSCAVVLTGTEGCVTSRLGEFVASVTGANSFTASHGVPGRSSGKSHCGLPFTSSV